MQQDSSALQKQNIGELCKGSTTDSDSVCEGSNPSSPTTQKSSSVWLLLLLLAGV